MNTQIGPISDYRDQQVQWRSPEEYQCVGCTETCSRVHEPEWRVELRCCEKEGCIYTAVQRIKRMREQIAKLMPVPRDVALSMPEFAIWFSDYNVAVRSAKLAIELEERD